MQRTADRLRSGGKTIAVVPTMGFLHAGHLELIKTAKRNADNVITTIFVNPTQFGPSEDFSRYPRDLDRDIQLSTEAGTDYVFAPPTEGMYSPGHATFVNVERLSTVLEGKSRPGHFRGVATIVAKLFNITKPHLAVFGQKDAQQVVVIRHMIHDLNIDVELVVCPTVREPDGLAMSSRNTYLTPEQRAEAPVLFKSLKLAELLIKEGERFAASITSAMRELITSHSSAVIDYLSVADAATLRELDECRGHILISLAARFGSTRLIDNITLEV